MCQCWGHQLVAAFFKDIDLDGRMTAWIENGDPAAPFWTAEEERRIQEFGEICKIEHPTPPELRNIEAVIEDINTERNRVQSIIEESGCYTPKERPLPSKGLAWRVE